MSQIAMANAFFRARESALPAEQRILDDPHAQSLVRTIWKLRLLWSVRGLIPGLSRLFDELQTVHCVRHAAVDALVAQALREGVRQVVLLGAGLDARPSRFGAEYPDVRWFEVDRSPYIAHKGSVLDRRQVTSVTADLSTPQWTQRLVDAGLDRGRETLWVAEGLIHYLPSDMLEHLLRDIRGLALRPRFALTFIRPEVAAQASGALVRLLRLLAEIPAVYFRAADLVELARQQDWTSVQTWDYDQQVASFAPAARARPRSSGTAGSGDLRTVT